MAINVDSKIADANVGNQPPDEYERFVIGVEEALRPGAEIFVRYHSEETGAPGQVAHIIIRHPCAEGWAEVYSDGV